MEGTAFLGVLVVVGAIAYVTGMRRRRRIARERAQDRWKRGGAHHQASLAARDMQPWLRNANGLPPVHDEKLFHD
jgi:hypothetical protein